MNEVEKLATLSHLNVLNVIETCKEGKIEKEDGSLKDVLYVVLELAQGGELFDYVMETGKLQEAHARFYFRQMIDGIKHIHDNGLTHRDLKPENLLFDENFNLKIADFGFAASLEGNDGSGVCRTYLGTPFYMAPEIHEKKTYDGKKVDITAAGIILFILMAQNPPFRVADKRQDRLYQFISQQKEHFFWKLHGR
jgi:serine/threonine protein kinase